MVEALLQNLRDNPFYEVAILLLIAAVVGAVAVRLRQPLIIGFIAVGILVGPRQRQRVAKREGRWDRGGFQLTVLARGAL